MLLVIDWLVRFWWVPCSKTLDLTTLGRVNYLSLDRVLHPWSFVQGMFKWSTSLVYSWSFLILLKLMFQWIIPYSFLCPFLSDILPFEFLFQMADVPGTLSDGAGHIHSNGLHWQGFPRLLWESLQLFCYTEPPQYNCYTYTAEGVIRCTVRMIIPQHPFQVH